MRTDSPTHQPKHHSAEAMLTHSLTGLMLCASVDDEAQVRP